MNPDPQLTQESIRAIESVARGAGAEPSDLDAPELYINRELSWVDFNDRVLQLAEDPDQPLLERCKFAAIFGSNLDEFFMIRVAGLHDQVDAGIDGAQGSTAGRRQRRSTRSARRSWRSSSASAGRSRTTCARRWPSTASASSGSTTSPSEARRALDRSLPPPDLPGAHAAGRRPRPAVPLHLEPVAEPRRARARPGHRPGHLRARQGPEGDAAAVRRARATSRRRSCRSRR